MRFRIFLSALISAFAASAPAHDQPGMFDFYVLNLSWEPEFCHSPRNADKEECQTGGRGFVVHGLWPQFAQGYPEHCSHARGPLRPEDLRDLMPEPWLVQHEWSTHGTCSGLSADAYFATLRRAYVSLTIPEPFKAPTRNQSFTPAAIKQTFTQANTNLKNDNIAVSCGNNYLTAIEICLSKDSLKPVTCEGLRDCRANSVRVTPVK